MLTLGLVMVVAWVLWTLGRRFGFVRVVLLLPLGFFVFAAGVAAFGLAVWKESAGP